MPANNDSFTPNPFTLVFDALWSLLESSPLFTADVAVKNRIKYNLSSDRNPFKAQIQDADLPEVILISSGMDIKLFANSSSTQVTKRYSWILSTGDVRINNYLYQVQWDVLIGMTGWQKLLGELIWPVNTGTSFVKRADITDSNEGMTDVTNNRGITGWSSLMNIEVEMWFKSQDLIDQRGY